MVDHRLKSIPKRSKKTQNQLVPIFHPPQKNKQKIHIFPVTAVQQVEKWAGGRQQPHDGHARSSQAFQDGRWHLHTDVAIAEGHRAAVLRDRDGHPN